MGAGPKAAGCFLAAFPFCRQGAVLEVEQPGRKPCASQPLVVYLLLSYSFHLIEIIAKGCPLFTVKEALKYGNVLTGATFLSPQRPLPVVRQ